MTEKKEQDCNLAPQNNIDNIDYKRIESQSQEIEEIIKEKIIKNDCEMQFILALLIGNKTNYERAKSFINIDFFTDDNAKYLYLEIENQYKNFKIEKLSLLELSKNSVFEKLKYTCNNFYTALMTGLNDEIQYRLNDELDVAISNILYRQIQILAKKITETKNLDSIQKINKEINDLFAKIEEKNKSNLEDDLFNIDDIFNTDINKNLLYKTEIKKIDKTIIGINPGTVTTVLAKPNHGKTAIAIQIAKNQCVSRPDLINVFFAKEQTTKEIKYRLLNLYTGININQVINQESNIKCIKTNEHQHNIISYISIDEAKQILKKANEQIKQDLSNLIIKDSGFENIRDISYILETIKEKYPNKKIGNIYIDHWHAFSFSGDNKTAYQENEAANLLALVKKFDCHCFLLAQAKKKEVINKGNTLRNIPLNSEDIKGSGAIKEISHQVWIIHNPSDEEKTKDQLDENNKAFFLLDKSRNTAPGQRENIFYNRGNCTFV